MTRITGHDPRPGMLGEEALPPLTEAAIEQALRARDPRVRLVLPRILRRVILEDRDLTTWGIRVPHRKSYAADTHRLLEIAAREELGLAPGERAPSRLILLPAPDPEWLARQPAGDVLRYFWRLLFHARIHMTLEERVAAGRLDAAELRRRIHTIGPAVFAEAREVLSQDGFLLPPADERELYTEFAAVYLELRYFAPGLLPRYFPVVERFEAIDAALAEDLDAQELFTATRPQGATPPLDSPEPEADDAWAIAENGEADEASPARTPCAGDVTADEGSLPGSAGEQPSAERDAKSSRVPWRFRRLMARADRASRVGNQVRAILLRLKAVRVVPILASQAWQGVQADLDRLVSRLQSALDLDPQQPPAWREALAALGREAPRGTWSAEARLLYDLQKACVDHERQIHASDLVEWVLSLGRRPIKRPLPGQSDILMSTHLRSAQRRLPVVRLCALHRRELAQLLRHGIQRVEERIRSRFRPEVHRVLDEVGLVPATLPERVARQKLVEELLDRIVERGYVTMGDFRDAISRNNLKLADFARLADLLRGDPVLRADQRLATALDGVYRRGEFYLRWMQQLASLAFGTQVGRGLVRFAALPFVGAFVALAFLQHALDDWVGLEGVRVKTWELVAGLGLFLLCLINIRAFRQAVWHGLKAGFRGLRLLMFDLPRWILARRWVQWLLRSRPARLATRYGIKPAVLTALAWVVLPRKDVSPELSLGLAAGIFAVVNLLLNSRMGRNAEEILAEAVVEGWRRFGWRPLMTLLSLVMEVSKLALEAVERFLYAVDELLRFRSGESNLTLALKAVGGAGWFLATYVFRFAINVVIEPQINPIKHFPVVTVAHKVFLPFVAVLQGWLASAMNEFLAWLVAFLISVSLPGICGFLVWELKESWRLYAANRRRCLAPVPIGSHGETMSRLLRRGFHSGTLPKRFARLRRAERAARQTGNWKRVRQHLHALHHVEEAVRRWVQREFIALLTGCGMWRAGPLVVDEVRLATGAIHVGLTCPRLRSGPLVLAFEVRAGWLLVGILRPGWASHVPAESQPALAAALVGLYQSAGADLLRQQIEAELPTVTAYDLVPEGIVVWPDPDFQREVLYEMDYGPWIPPQQVRGPRPRRLPALERERLWIGRLQIPWHRWVTLWEEDLPGRRPWEDLSWIQVLPSSPPPLVSSSR